ncbi:MAG: PAS domain S-box protein, partial [Methanobacterium sp.]
MDNTDRWLEDAVKNLHESESTYRGLFESLAQAIQICELVFDDNGQPVDVLMLDVNAAYEKHSGLKKNEVIGKHIKDILPVIEQVWLDRYAEIVREGKSMHFEDYNASLDKWFDVHASPLGGNRFAAIFTDITEHKKAEDELSESEERYRNLVEVSPDAIIVHSEGKIRFTNSAAMELFGANDRNKLIGKPILSLLSEEMRDVGKQRIKQAEDAQTPLIELKYVRLDGSFFDGEATGKSIIYQGKPAIQVVIRDITERKKAEEALRESEVKYRNIVETANEGIIMIDAESKVTYVNNMFTEMLG